MDTPIIVPLTELQVCLTLEAMWTRFRAENRLVELWSLDTDGTFYLTIDGTKHRQKFLRILHAQQAAALN